MRKWIPPLLIVVATLVSVFMYPKLPDQVPTHWGMDGTVNGWSSRIFSAWLMPVMMAGIWLIMRLLPHVDPRKANYPRFKGMYEALIVLTLVFMLGIHVLVLTSATGARFDMARIAPLGIGAFFVAIGLLLPKAQSNFFVGIRTPWTLTSELSWERTHKLGGMLFVVVGVLTAAAALIRPQLSVPVLIASTLGMTLLLFVYSYRVWKRDTQRRSLF